MLTRPFSSQVSGLEEWHRFHYHLATWHQQELMCAQPGPIMSVAVQTEQVSTGTMSLSPISDGPGLWRPYATQITLTNMNPLNGHLKQEDIDKSKETKIWHRHGARKLLQSCIVKSFLALVCCLQRVRAHSHTCPHKRCFYKPQQRNLPYKKGLGLSTVHGTELLPLDEDLKNAEARCIHRALLHCLKAAGTTSGR